VKKARIFTHQCLALLKSQLLSAQIAQYDSIILTFIILGELHYIAWRRDLIETNEDSLVNLRIYGVRF